MNYEELVKPAIRTQPVYEPGKPIEIVAHELGLAPGDIAKLASNENPLGSSPLAVEAATRALTEARLYPENSAFYLRRKLAARLELEPDMITVSAGSNELLYMVGDLFLAPGLEVVMGRSAFITAKIVTLLYGATPVEVPLTVDLRHDLDAMLAAITPRTRLVYLPDPNNPTGTACEPADVLRFAEALPDHVVLVYDEAYTEYRDNAPDLRPLIRAGRKILGTRTFSKIYGLAGLRVGYGYSPAALAGLLDRVRPPFNVAAPALAAALAALDDEAWVLASRKANREGLRQLGEGLTRLGLAFVPSQANFLLVRLAEADTVYQQLQMKGLIVRPVGGYQLPDYLRFSVGTAAQNQRLLDALRDIGASGTASPRACS